MSEIYVTLDEAARLEEISYRAFQMKMQRDKTRFLIKHEAVETGGKDRVLIAVSSLSSKAQNAYKKLQEADKLSEQGAAIIEEKAINDRPWYVDIDLEWFIENYPDNYYKGVELSKLIREFLNYDDKNRSIYAEEFAQKHLGKGQRTLYRYTKAYIEASAWVIKMDRESGGSHDFYKVLALCRKPTDTDRFPSFSQEVKDFIKGVWFNKNFAANRGSKEMLYEKLQEIARLNGWEKVPSYPSVARYINHLMETKSNARFLAERGTREYKNKKMLKTVRDIKALQVMEVVMGDEHTFDCWVSYKCPNGKMIAIRPKLVAWIDVRSRAILGDVICKDANSDILKESLLKMLTSEIGGVPKYLYIDNGKDYTAETMTGRKRNDRGSGCSDLEFDAKTRGFYRSIGIEDVHRALPYEPWSKTQIERFFGGVCSRFTKWMASYTGTLTGSKTEAKVKKDIKKMLENGELLTMEAFYDLWSHWLEENYMNRVHTSLKDEEYKTPKSVFLNGDRYFKPAPPRAQLVVLMQKEKNVRVYNTGIKMFGNFYRSVELAAYIDKQVTVRYDKRDVTSVFVYDEKDNLICEAQCQELLRIAPHIPQEALEQHIKMQKQQLREDKAVLEDADEVLRTLSEQYAGFEPVAGGIDLTGGKAKGKTAKVVSMPEDAAYRNNKSVRKPEAEEEQQKSKLLDMYAEIGKRKIKAIGQE